MEGAFFVDRTAADHTNRKGMYLMKNVEQYAPQFFPVKNPPMRWASKTMIEKAPVWCSVDLRDGNQALITPMNLEEKLEFFRYLVKLSLIHI